MVKLDHYTSEIRCIDSSNEIWHCQIMNLKYKWLAEGQYIRVRQATIQNHKSYHRVFGIKSHTNIMSLPHPCKIAEEMHFQEEQLSKQMDLELLNNHSEVMQHPVVISKVKDSSLLLEGLSKLTEKDADDKEHRCRLNVNAIWPPVAGSDCTQYLRIVNTKSGASRKLKNKSEKPKTGEKLQIEL